MQYRIPNYIMMMYSYDWEKLLLYFIIVYLTTFFNHQAKKYECWVLGIKCWVLNNLPWFSNTQSVKNTESTNFFPIPNTYTKIRGPTGKIALRFLVGIPPSIWTSEGRGNRKIDSKIMTNFEWSINFLQSYKHKMHLTYF